MAGELVPAVGGGPASPHAGLSTCRLSVLTRWRWLLSVSNLCGRERGGSCLLSQPSLRNFTVALPLRSVCCESPYWAITGGKHSKGGLSENLQTYLKTTTSSP